MSTTPQSVQEMETKEEQLTPARTAAPEETRVSEFNQTSAEYKAGETERTQKDLARADEIRKKLKQENEREKEAAVNQLIDFAMKRLLGYFSKYGKSKQRVNFEAYCKEYDQSIIDIAKQNPLEEQTPVNRDVIIVMRNIYFLTQTNTPRVIEGILLDVGDGSFDLEKKRTFALQSLVEQV